VDRETVAEKQRLAQGEVGRDVLLIAFFSAREIAMKGTMKSRMRIRPIIKTPDLPLKFRMNRMETIQ
jgi:hypothetical protein